MNTNLIFWTLLLSLGHAAATFGQPTVLSPSFTKITTGSLVADLGAFTGCAWGDFDNDGNLDVIVANWANHTNVLYRNVGNGTFTKISDRDPVLDLGYHFGLAWGDFNNDGYLDLVALDGVGASSPGKCVLYQNGGDGAFRPVSTGPSANENSYFAMCSWADYDHDGWLDLFTTLISGSSQEIHNNLYHNNQDGTFTKVTSGQIVTDLGVGSGCVWGDYDNDGFADLFVSNEADNALNFLYHNNRDGTFTRITNSVVATDHGTCSCGAWGDYDNDGFLDLFVAGFTDSKNRLYRNNGDGTFSTIASGPMLINPSGSAIHGASWGDYDNDGYLDLFLANEFGNNALFHNNGDSTFTQIKTGPMVSDGGNKGACSWVDYDNDGFLDLFVTRGGDQGLQTNLLYHNNGNSNAWMKVKCVGTISNRSAIGTKVRVLARIRGKPVWQLREITGRGGWNSVPLLAHLGLGDATNIDVMRIEWPSGTVQELKNQPANQSLTLTEPPRLLSSIASGHPQFSLRGGRGFQYGIDVSTDLVRWSPLNTLTITNSDGTGLIANTNVGGANTQFYRAALH